MYLNLFIIERKYIVKFEYYLILLILPYYNFRTFLMQFPALLTIILFKLYNGKLGYSAKNFFYLFYPVHLLILVFIEKIF